MTAHGPTLSKAQAAAILAMQLVVDDRIDDPSGAELAGIAWHLQNDLGLECRAYMANVGDTTRSASTQYLFVNGLRISRWGESSPRSIGQGAFGRGGMEHEKAPEKLQLLQAPMDTRPEWFDEHDMQRAQDVRARLAQHDLVAMATERPPMLPVHAYAQSLMRTAQEGMTTSNVTGLLAGVMFHLRELGVTCSLFSQCINVDRTELHVPFLEVERMRFYPFGETLPEIVHNVGQSHLQGDIQLVGFAKTIHDDDLNPFEQKAARAFYLRLTLLRQALDTSGARGSLWVDRSDQTAGSRDTLTAVETDTTATRLGVAKARKL